MTLQSDMDLCTQDRYVLQGYDDYAYPVSVAASEYDKHVLVLGVTGTGKTTLMVRLVHQLMQQGGAALIIDSHRDFLLGTLARVPDAKRVVYLDPTSDEGWGCNLLQCVRASVAKALGRGLHDQMVRDQAVEVMLDILSRLQEDTLGHEAGASIRQLLRNALFAALEREDTSLVDVHAILSDANVRDALVPALGQKKVAAYFQHEYPKLPASHRDRVLNKLQPLTSAVLSNLFSRRNTEASLQGLFEDGALVFADLYQKRLGAPTSSLIGYALFVLAMHAIDQRRGRDQAPITVAADEFGDYASTVTARIFTQARKRNARFLVGLQSLNQLPEEVRDEALHAATKCVFRTGATDASALCAFPAVGSWHGQP